MSYQNSGVTLSKVYYSNTKYHLCMNSVSPHWRSILYLRENSRCNIKALFLSIKYDSESVNIVSKIPNIVKSQYVYQIVLIHQILNSNRSKIYHSDPRYQFSMNTASPFDSHLKNHKKIQITHQIRMVFPKNMTFIMRWSKRDNHLNK